MASPKGDKVIAHYRDGTLLKGSTWDFSPSCPRFHVGTTDGEIHLVHIGELKALFFVKSFDGSHDYHERKGFFNQDPGNRVMVEFFDGEIVFGHTITYSPNGDGFFLVPGDPESNNIKVYVVNASTKRVKIKPAMPGDRTPETDENTGENQPAVKSKNSKKNTRKPRKKRRPVKSK